MTVSRLFLDHDYLIYYENKSSLIFIEDLVIKSQNLQPITDQIDMKAKNKIVLNPGEAKFLHFRKEDIHKPAKIQLQTHYNFKNPERAG